DDFLGERFHVAAGYGAKENEFEKLIVRQRLGRCEKAGAQPLPMARIMRRFPRPVPHGAVSALRVGRAVETRWRFGEKLATIRRDTDRMFELGRSEEHTSEL